MNQNSKFDRRAPALSNIVITQCNVYSVIDKLVEIRFFIIV